jgi:hypothetical protein
MLERGLTQAKTGKATPSFVSSATSSPNSFSGASRDIASYYDPNRFAGALPTTAPVSQVAKDVAAAPVAATAATGGGWLSNLTDAALALAPRVIGAGLTALTPSTLGSGMLSAADKAAMENDALIQKAYADPSRALDILPAGSTAPKLTTFPAQTATFPDTTTRIAPGLADLTTSGATPEELTADLQSAAGDLTIPGLDALNVAAPATTAAVDETVAPVRGAGAIFGAGLETLPPISGLQPTIDGINWNNKHCLVGLVVTIHISNDNMHRRHFIKKLTASHEATGEAVYIH